MFALHDPMLPSLGRTPFHAPGWVYEEKCAGFVSTDALVDTGILPAIDCPCHPSLWSRTEVTR